MTATPDPRFEQALAHAGFVRAVAQSVLGRDPEVEDVLQETLLVAWRRPPTQPGALRAWLGTVARRLAVTRLRAHGRREGRERRAARPEGLPSVEELVVREEARRRLVAAVLTLDEPYRTTLLWRSYAARSIPEIANLMAVPVATVRTRLQRALARVRERLDRDHGGDRRSWAIALAPLADLESGAAVAAAAAGGLVMKKVALALTAVLLAVGGYAVATKPHESSRPDVVAPALAATTAAAGAAGEVNTSEAVAGLAAAGPERGRATMTVEADPPTFVGRVVDGAGRPVVGATVEGRYYWWAARSLAGSHAGVPLVVATTDGAGRFRLGASPYAKLGGAERALVRVLADGFAVRHEHVEQGTDARIVLGLGGLLSLRLTDERGGAVVGAFGELHDGDEAIPVGVQSYARPRLDLSGGSDARLEVRVAPGRYRARVGAAGLRRVDTDLLVVEEGRTTSRTIVLDEGIVAAFHVVNDAGEPIADAVITTIGPLGSGGEGATDADGRRRVVGISLPVATGPNFAPTDDRLHFRVEAEGFVPVVAARGLPPGPAVLPIDVRLTRGVEVRVRVVDATGAPIPAPTARWVTSHVHTGPFGQGLNGRVVVGDWIRLPRVEPGTRRVAVRSGTDDSFEAIERELSIGPEGADVTLTVGRLDRTVAGTVFRFDGSRASEGTIRRQITGTEGDPLRTERSATLDADGHFRLERIRAGDGTFVVSVPGHAPQAFPVEIRADGPAQRVELRLREGKPITGRVVDREGVPLAGLTIELSRTVEVAKGVWSVLQEATVPSGADGSFAFVAEDGPAYRVGVTSAAWVAMQQSTPKVRAGATDVLIRLKPASEGWGMLLRVFATSGGRPYEGPLTVSWAADGGQRRGSELLDDALGGRQFGVWGAAGSYDLTFWAPGHRPTVVSRVALDEASPAGRTLNVDLDRGAIVRVRLRDAQGRPVTGTWVRIGTSTLRTDDSGELESSGWDVGSHPEFRVALVADPEFTIADVAGVSAPGTADVTLRRRGFVSVRLAQPLANLDGDAVLRVTDSGGTIIDERRIVAADVATWVGEARFALSIVATGTHTVAIQVGARRATAPIEAALGRWVEATVPWP